MTDHFFKPGDVVAYRGVLGGKVTWACAATVVEDRPDLTAIYWRTGTPVVRPAARPTPQSILDNDIPIIPDRWKKTDVLSINQPGAAYSLELMWLTGTTNFDCWYVHLQETMRRSAVGFDTMDQMLDIVISPDKSTWRWKDEDEFEEAVVIGVYSPEEAASIRAEGERVIERLNHNQPPFCDGWENWRPPTEWGIPDLPEGWDRVD
jgi:hypothetical protein